MTFPNGLKLHYSNGLTEGDVNRVKLINRSMYGQASFVLLRNKVLYQAAKPNQHLAEKPQEARGRFTKRWRRAECGRPFPRYYD